MVRWSTFLDLAHLQKWCTTLNTFDFNSRKEFEHLSNPPVVEAIIAWTAPMESPQSFESLQQSLRADLPGYPKHESIGLVNVSATVAVGQQDNTVVSKSEWTGIRATSDDGSHVAIFNRNEFSFSELRPYSRWSSFSSEALRLWRIYCRIGRPTEIQRLAVRYINRFGPISDRSFEKYLTSSPAPLATIGLPTREFLCSTQHSLPDDGLLLNVVQTVVPSSANIGDIDIVIDFDVVTTQALPCDDALVVEQLEKMRVLKNHAFFQLLRPEIVQQFK